MKKVLLSLLFSALLILTAACADVLEGYRLVEFPHVNPQPPRPASQYPEASNYEELKLILLGFVEMHREYGRIVLNAYDGDIKEDLERAKYEIMNNNPLGAFAVYEMNSSIVQVFTHIELDIGIEFKRTEHDVAAIVNVESIDELRELLYTVMLDYALELKIRSSLHGITADRVIELIRATYYENPRYLIMMPTIAVATFPETGNDKIFEIHFGHIYTPLVLERMATSLIGSVIHNADAAVGDNDAITLLSLVEILIRVSDFDDGTARALSEHGTQNLATTAFGALVTGSAVGEGFAMAMKALCDELGIESSVVLGYLNGKIHAWNLVRLDDNYYHIDAAMASVYGIETVFLLSDDELEQLGYVWDRTRFPQASGVLNYENVRLMVAVYQAQIEAELGVADDENEEQNNGLDDVVFDDTGENDESQNGISNEDDANDDEEEEVENEDDE